MSERAYLQELAELATGSGGRVGHREGPSALAVSRHPRAALETVQRHTRDRIEQRYRRFDMMLKHLDRLDLDAARLCVLAAKAEHAAEMRAWDNLITAAEEAITDAIRQESR